MTIDIDFNLTKVQVTYDINPPEEDVGDNGIIIIEGIIILEQPEGGDISDLLEMREDVIHEEIRRKPRSTRCRHYG